MTDNEQRQPHDAPVHTYQDYQLPKMPLGPPDILWDPSFSVSQLPSLTAGE